MTSGSGDRVPVEPGSGERVEPTLFAQGAGVRCPGGAARRARAPSRDRRASSLGERRAARGRRVARRAAQRRRIRSPNRPRRSGPRRCGLPRGRPQPRRRAGAAEAPGPDHDIECIVALQPVRAGHRRRARRRPARADRQAAALVRPPRRAAPGSYSKSTRPGEFTEVTACMLLADRNGAATRTQLDDVRAADRARSRRRLPAAFVPPDVDREAARAETLDRICAPTSTCRSASPS